MEITEANKTSALTLWVGSITEIPDAFNRAEVVETGCGLESMSPPSGDSGQAQGAWLSLNRERKNVAAPCGLSRARSMRDPKTVYEVTPATEMVLKRPDGHSGQEHCERIKIIALRECPLPTQCCV